MKEYIQRRKHRTKGFVEYKYKIIARNCLNCTTYFETPFVKSLYCSRKCYMAGVTSRSRAWLKTSEGKTWTKQYRTDKSREIRIGVLRKLGGKCKHCGFSDFRALQIDHINGGGHQERNTRRTMYRDIYMGRADESKYQLLCANCNWIKRFNNQEGNEHDDYNDFLKHASIIEKQKNSPIIYT